MLTKSPNVDTIVDFDFAKRDRKDGVGGAPKSDAELLGHELKHDEFEFFNLPNSEEGATQGIDDILNTKTDKNLQKTADQFVDDLLKPNPPPPPPPQEKKDPQ